MPVHTLVGLIGGPPRAWPQGWEDWTVTREAHFLASEQFLAGLPPYPQDRYAGRGIVLAGGGVRYFPSLYVTIRAIRGVGCRLPIQVWYLGRDGEMPGRHAELLAPFAVKCVDADAVRREHPCRILNGWELKVYALLHSPFEEVLLLDADCYPVLDPASLFDDPGYRERGAVFWPDLEDSPYLDWEAFGVAPTGRTSIESGQAVVNKRACWRPLQLAWWYGDHSDWSYLHGYGDKHSFEVAWARCGFSYHRFAEAVTWSEHSFLHAGPGGGTLFLHRCKDKFRFGTHDYLNPQAFEANHFHPSLPLEHECFGWLAYLARELDMPREGLPRVASDWPAQPTPVIRAFMYTCPARQAIWEGTMTRWRATDWGADPVVVWDDGPGSPSTGRIVQTARRMLTRAAREQADYYLFLEDDLLFNLFLRENLESWAPLRNGSLWIGSLYNPGLFARDEASTLDRWNQRTIPIAHGGYYGTQAIVLSRAALSVVLQEWDEPGPYDLKIEAIGARHCEGILVHAPSLVQQIPVASTWGGGPHRAEDFDPLYRASPEPSQRGPARREHFYESIPGWFDFQDLYANAVRTAAPGACFVEVGAWLGRSTAYLAVAIDQSGKAIQFHVVDHWQGGVEDSLQQQALREMDVYAAFEKNMRRGGVWGAINVLRADSTEAARQFPDGSVDFVFLDGSHDFESVRKDVLTWLPKIRPGGVLAGHDWHLFQVRPAVLSVLPEAGLQVLGSCWLWSVS